MSFGAGVLSAGAYAASGDYQSAKRQIVGATFGALTGGFGRLRGAGRIAKTWNRTLGRFHGAYHHVWHHRYRSGWSRAHARIATSAAWYYGNWATM